MNNIFAEFASLPLLAFKGMLVGIIASAPMGPVGILCIQRTMQKGRNYGLVTARALRSMMKLILSSTLKSFRRPAPAEKSLPSLPLK